MHVLQISFDEALLETPPEAEPYTRQLNYARLLCAARPDARLTIVVLTRRRDARAHTRAGLHIEPFVVRPIGRLAFASWLRRLHSKHPISLISTQNVFDEALIALAFSRIHRIPIIGQIHADLFTESFRKAYAEGRAGSLRYRAALLLVSRFSALRVVSHGIARKLESRGLHSNIHVLPVAMPLVKSCKGYVPAALPTEPTVLFVGRFCEQKRLDRWIDVASEVAAVRPDTRFILIGDGPLRNRIREMARERGLGDRCEFPGTVPNEQLPDWVRRASVFLLTSDFEGFGRVLAEVAVNCLPCVSTEIVGPEDVIKDGETGFLCPRDDVEGLASAVLDLLDHPAKARKMGLAAQARVTELFDPDRLAQGWVNLWLQTGPNTRPAVQMPRRRSLRRLSRLVRFRGSLHRALEYEAIEGIHLRGLTLDLGGGANNSYSRLLRLEGRVVSANISRKIRPTLLADLNEGLPFADGSFDNVLSLNIFEHVYEDRRALRDALRVLRPCGFFVFVVPFLFRRHGSPHDWHRHTLEWWADELIALGAAESTLRIDPLVWSTLTTALSLTRPTLPHPVFGLFALPAVLQDATLRSKRLPATGRNGKLLDYAVGYVITGTK